MNDDNIERMQHPHNRDENLPDDNQDEFFDEEGEDEPLDVSETDEDADEGTGDGTMGRRRDDPFDK